MAKILVPDLMFAMRRTRINSKMETIIGKTGQFHLVNPTYWKSDDGKTNYVTFHTACRLSPTYVVGDPRYSVLPVGSLHADQICKACTSVLIVVD